MTIGWASHLGALALVVLDVIARGVRIRLLARAGHQLSLWRAIAVNAYGDAASAVTPARLGGEPARFLGFRSAGIDGPRTVAALGTEAVADWVVIAASALALAAAFGGSGLHAVGRWARSGRDLLPWLAGIGLLLVLGWIAARWYRHRLGPRVLRFPAEAWRHFRSLPPLTIALATTLTLLSTAARVAVLPILLMGAPLQFDWGLVILGSFALLFGQLALPTPAGVGGVELGFVAGFAGTLPGNEVARLILTWRGYTLLLGAGLGALLFGRSFLSRRPGRR